MLDVGGAAPDGSGKSFWLPAAAVSYGKTYALDPVFCPIPNFIQGSGLHLPFKDKCFNIVTALDVLEHIPEADRTNFFAELQRVSSDMVLLSCPFQDESVQKAEDELSDLIGSLHDLQHQQLLEHKDCGLPDKKVVTDLITQHPGTLIDFPYGSIDTWLFIQSLKYCFLQKHNAARIQQKIDEFAARRLASLEFTAPFYRQFWLYSRNRSGEEMNAGLPQIKHKLSKDYPGSFSISDQALLNQELIRAFNPENVSAVIVPSRRQKNLDICLDHLLTQNTDFNLEVAVWNIYNDPDLEDFLKAFFPGVKCLSIPNKRTIAGALRAISLNLQGNFILYLSEGILLPASSTSEFFARAKAKSKFSLLYPRIIDEEGVDQVRFWGKKPGKKKSRELAQSSAQWLWSECRFYSRTALMALDDTRPFTRDNIFLSQNNPSIPQPLYCQEITVSYKGQH